MRDYVAPSLIGWAHAQNGETAFELVIFKLMATLLRLTQDGCHLPGDISKRIFLNKNIRISIKIWLKFVPMRSINNIPALFQIMAWRRPGDKPLSEPMMA